MHKIIILCLLLGLTACQHDRSAGQGEDLTLRYASLLHITRCDSFTTVEVKNAWKEQNLLATYILVPRDQKLPQQLPEGTLLRTPLQRAVLHSSIHAALLCDLHAQQRIAGIADTAYVISPRIKSLFSQDVADAGSSMQPDLEKLHKLNADAVLVSPFENSGHGILDRAGIPLIECADYMENSPLARAEWMRFYGLLFGQEERADSLFAAVEEEYNGLKKQVAQQQGERPTVFCDLRTGNVWYQPGGQSTMGQWIADAGGHYLWDDNPQHGSVPLDLEAVYAKAHFADIWLVKYGEYADQTYRKLEQECPAYSHFNAWKNKKIHACNTMRTPFYEETPFHPERLLKDLIHIFHPNILPSYSPHYYVSLGE